MPNNKAIVEKQENALANINELLDPGVQTMDVSKQGMMFPPELKILTDISRQMAQFSDGLELSGKDVGKLFIKGRDPISTDELKSVVEGTLLRIEHGTEVFSIGDDGRADTRVARLPYMIPKRDKDEWMDNNPGKMYKPTLKFVLTNHTAEECKYMLQQLMESGEGEHPFFTITIQGGRWGAWIDASRKIDTLFKEKYPGKDWTKAWASFIQLSISTKTEQGAESGRDYLTYDFEPTINEPEVVTSFREISKALVEDFSYFGKVNKGEIVTDNVAKSVERKDNYTAKVVEETQDAEVVGEDADPLEDLPF